MNRRRRRAGRGAGRAPPGRSTRRAPTRDRALRSGDRRDVRSGSPTPRSRWSSGARCTTPAVPRTRAAPSSEGSSGSGDGGDLAVELEAWYLTSAVLLPERAPDAHRRVDTILEHPGQTSSPAQRALMSKALIMRMYAGDPRDGLVALARELYARRPAAGGGRAGLAGRRPRGRGAQLLRRIRRGRRRARPGPGSDPAQRLGDVGRRRLAVARAPATVDGADPGRGRGRPHRRRHLHGRDAALPAGRRPLPDPRADRARRAGRGRGALRRASTATPPPPGSSPRGSTSRGPGWPPIAATMRGRWRRSWPAASSSRAC